MCSRAVASGTALEQRHIGQNIETSSCQRDEGISNKVKQLQNGAELAASGMKEYFISHINLQPGTRIQ